MNFDRAADLLVVTCHTSQLFLVWLLVSRNMYICAGEQSLHSKSSLFNFQKHINRCCIFGVHYTPPLQSSVTHNVGRGTLKALYRTFEFAAGDSADEDTV